MVNEKSEEGTSAVGGVPQKPQVSTSGGGRSSKKKGKRKR
jgi:hypothetical protein